MMNYNLPKKNWILIGICILLILAGFFLTAGAPSGEVYNPDIFSFRRVTLGPMISLAGFVGMVVAILFPFKQK